MSAIRFSAILFIFLCLLAEAKAQINEDFEDGDFTSNPEWTGDADFFVVENGLLRSNSSTANTYFLNTVNELIDEVQWEFFINLDFSTSGANFVDVYLVANGELATVQNGYFLRFGGTPDEISFYKLSGGVEELLIDGDDGVIGSSSNNIFDVLVTRSGAGEWSIFFDEGQSGEFVSGGAVTDLQFTETSFFGILIEQSSAASPINSHFFDNIVVGPIPIDETPPEVSSAQVLSATSIQVLFSEAITELSAGTLGNYQTAGLDGEIISAVLSATNPQEVELTLDIPIPNGTSFELQVQDIEDIEGNAMEAQTIPLFFVVPEPGGFKQVVINEIFADPSPSQGLPEEEYLELYNASDAFFDFEGWALVNTTSFNDLAPLVVAPGDYIILCDAQDVGLFESFGTVIGIPSFSALTNSGDSLTLLNAQGDIIDLVVYDDEWYGDPEFAEGGYSLELINPETPCSGPNNWSASTADLGGTPGQENSIFDLSPDLSPPQIESFDVLSSTQLILTFSDPLDPQSVALNGFNWTEGISSTGFEISSDLTMVTLTISPELALGITYTLSILDITDCEGNVIDPDTSIELILGAEPNVFDVLITEIMADPSPAVNILPEVEYFELHNASDVAIDLRTVRLNDESFVNAPVLLPGEYIICTSEATAAAFEPTLNVYGIPDLSETYLTNGGRLLELISLSGEIIDRVDYDLDWYGDSDKEDGGFSLERINLDEPCKTSSNWTGSSSPSGGTPGLINSVNSDIPDVNPPKVLDALLWSPDTLQVRFDERLDSLSVLVADISINPELIIVEVLNQAPAYESILVILESPVESNVVYEVNITGIADCTGNGEEEVYFQKFGFPEEAEPGDLLINEVLFNPRTGGVDFVEIVNVSSRIISLQNRALQNQDLTTRVITEQAQVIFPGSYLVFTSDAQNIALEYPLGLRENYFEMESLPSYSNGAGSVILTDAFEIPVDQFDYSEDYHLSLLNSVKGVSLERLSFSRPTNDPGNWTSAAENIGFATPGYQNSQFNPEGKPGASFELENELFSPDNDGFQDILLLNYLLDTSGNFVTVFVYDRRGRKIYEMANNVLLGTEGTLSWDGVVDNGTKARIGPHILFVQLFNQDGNTETFKIPFIVAGRLSN